MTVKKLDETAAADSLKPNGGPTKAQLMSQVVSTISGMSKQDLSHFLNDTLAQVGKEADNISGGSAAKNKASISTKGTVKEELAEVFGEDEALTEETREKISVLFEAAVNTQVSLEVARIEEELDAQLTEAVESHQETILENLESYLDYAINEWVKTNEIAIESSLRADIMESFVEGLKNLFKEHYVEVPEEKVDVLGELSAENEALSDKLNESINENIELKKAIFEIEKHSALKEVSEGLAATQVEKLQTLAEGVEADDIEAFKKKVSIIKENHFNKKTSTGSTQLIVEEAPAKNADDVNEKSEVTGPMARYVKAISKTTIK
jgi:hypothetical protein